MRYEKRYPRWGKLAPPRRSPSIRRPEDLRFAPGRWPGPPGRPGSGGNLDGISDADARRLADARPRGGEPSRRAAGLSLRPEPLPGRAPDTGEVERRGGPGLNRIRLWSLPMGTPTGSTSTSSSTGWRRTAGRGSRKPTWSKRSRGRQPESDSLIQRMRSADFLVPLNTARPHHERPHPGSYVRSRDRPHGRRSGNRTDIHPQQGPVFSLEVVKGAAGDRAADRYLGLARGACQDGLEGGEEDHEEGAPSRRSRAPRAVARASSTMLVATAPSELRTAFRGRSAGSSTVGRSATGPATTPVAVRAPRRATLPVPDGEVDIAQRQLRSAGAPGGAP